MLVGVAGRNALPGLLDGRAHAKSPGLFSMKIKPCRCFAGLTAYNTLNLAGIVFAIRPRARRHVAASRFACFARYWRIEASRFGAKRGSRCCELSRNEGLRCCGTCCYGLGRLNTVFLLRVPKRFRAMVAHTARGLAFRGAGRSCSRHAGPGSPGAQAAISRAA